MADINSRASKKIHRLSPEKVTRFPNGGPVSRKKPRILEIGICCFGLNNTLENFFVGNSDPFFIKKK